MAENQQYQAQLETYLNHDPELQNIMRAYSNKVSEIFEKGLDLKVRKASRTNYRTFDVIAESVSKLLIGKQGEEV